MARLTDGLRCDGCQEIRWTGERQRQRERGLCRSCRRRGKQPIRDGCRNCGRPLLRRGRRYHRDGLCGVCRGNRSRWGLVHAGAGLMSARALGAQMAWGTRRAVYGEAGCTAIGRARRIAALRAWNAGHGGNPNRQKAVCKHGHPFTPENTYAHHNRFGSLIRSCRLCLHRRSCEWRWRRRQQSRSRPLWADLPTGRVNIAIHDAWFRREYGRRWQRLLAAHPDHGGTHMRFIREKRALDAFVDEQRQWYAPFGLEPPTRQQQAA